MNPERISDKTMTDYRQSLILALRLADMPGARIGEVVAEVESHVADTGEDPNEEFGTPSDYAAHLTAECRRTSKWYLASIAVAAAVAGWLIAQGALALLMRGSYFDRPGWLWLGLGLLIGIPLAVHLQRRATSVRDPRTGEDMVPARPGERLILFGLPLALIAVAWIVIEMVSSPR